MSTRPAAVVRRSHLIPRTNSPQVGEIWLYSLGDALRPFLVSTLPEARTDVRGGWLFHAPPVDAHTAEIKEQVPDPARRSLPCYLVVPVTSLTPVPAPWR